mgnify:FL=1
MKSTDKQRFCEMLTGLGEYYGKPISKMMMDIYAQGLANYDIDDISKAFSTHVRNPDNGQFMPKIADVERSLNGNSATRAMRAWNKVTKAVQEIGTYRTVKFDDPLINSVIQDMGGWTAIGQITEDELPFRIKEFEKRYQAYLQISPSEPVSALIGVFEKQNRTDGYYEDETVLIGNHNKTLSLGAK